MKLLSISVFLLLQLGGHTEAFSLSMSSASPPAGRSALSQQYKSIMSVHHGISAGYPRMAPPGEPEPEVDPRRKNPDDQPARGPVRMPVVDDGRSQKDVISRLLQDRIILLGQGVDDDIANVLVAQLLYLANEDPTKDITLYINSPGGSVSAGMAIYDTMQYVPCDVSTVCFGMAASMGAFLLGAGAPGKRRALPNARIMIHQPLGGAQGQAADIEIQAKEILFIREVLNTYIAEYCGQPKDKIEADCDRDFFMTAEEAVDYGIIDEMIQTKTSHITKPPMPIL
jgi:ATP-dependent Clp endopeptidase proteolytic subunit ClpP